MKDATVVQMFQRQYNFSHIKRSRSLSKDALPSQPQKQFATTQKVHDDEHLFSRLKAASHVDNEGMMTFGHNVPFGLNVLHVRSFASKEAFANDLHGQNLPRRLVTALQDLAEGTHADYF